MNSWTESNTKKWFILNSHHRQNRDAGKGKDEQRNNTCAILHEWRNDESDDSAMLLDNNKRSKVDLMMIIQRYMVVVGCVWFGWSALEVVYFLWWLWEFRTETEYASLTFFMSTTIVSLYVVVRFFNIVAQQQKLITNNPQWLFYLLKKL